MGKLQLELRKIIQSSVLRTTLCWLISMWNHGVNYLFLLYSQPALALVKLLQSEFHNLLESQLEKQWCTRFKKIKKGHGFVSQCWRTSCSCIPQPTCKTLISVKLYFLFPLFTQRVTKHSWDLIKKKKKKKIRHNFLEMQPFNAKQELTPDCHEVVLD